MNDATNVMLSGPLLIDCVRRAPNVSDWIDERAQEWQWLHRNAKKPLARRLLASLGRHGRLTGAQVALIRSKYR